MGARRAGAPGRSVARPSWKGHPKFGAGRRAARERTSTSSWPVLADVADQPSPRRGGTRSARGCAARARRPRAGAGPLSGSSRRMLPPPGAAGSWLTSGSSPIPVLTYSRPSGPNWELPAVVLGGRAAEVQHRAPRTPRGATRRRAAARRGRRSRGRSARCARSPARTRSRAARAGRRSRRPSSIPQRASGGPPAPAAAPRRRAATAGRLRPPRGGRSGGPRRPRGARSGGPRGARAADRSNRTRP